MLHRPTSGKLVRPPVLRKTEMAVTPVVGPGRPRATLNQASSCPTFVVAKEGSVEDPTSKGWATFEKRLRRCNRRQVRVPHVVGRFSGVDTHAHVDVGNDEA